MTSGQIPREEKNRISHRGQAFRKIRKILEATKTQITKLEESAAKMEDRIDKASRAAQDIKDRTRIMKKKMGTIATIDSEESDRILGIDSGFEDDDIFDSED